MFTGKQDENIKFSVLKTIAGFLNSDGGKLIIGYDEKNKRFTGLQEDYNISKWADQDGFKKELWDYLEANIPKKIIDSCIDLDFDNIDNKDLAIIDVKRLFDFPVYIKKNFYIRRKNRTEPLEDPSEADTYRKEHF